MGSDAYQKLLREDAEISFNTFFPKRQLSNVGDVNAEELITRIEDIIFGIREMYCIKERLWSLVDFDKVIAKVFHNNYPFFHISIQSKIYLLYTIIKAETD